MAVKMFETIRLPVMGRGEWQTAQASADVGGWELVTVSNGYAYYKREVTDAVSKGTVSKTGK